MYVRVCECNYKSQWQLAILAPGLTCMWHPSSKFNFDYALRYTARKGRVIKVSVREKEREGGRDNYSTIKDRERVRDREISHYSSSTRNPYQVNQSFTVKGSVFIFQGSFYCLLLI